MSLIYLKCCYFQTFPLKLKKVILNENSWLSMHGCGAVVVLWWTGYLYRVSVPLNHWGLRSAAKGIKLNANSEWVIVWLWAVHVKLIWNSVKKLDQQNTNTVQLAILICMKCEIHARTFTFWRGKINKLVKIDNF